MEAILRPILAGFRFGPVRLPGAASERAPAAPAPAAEESVAPDPVDERTAGEKLRDARIAQGLSFEDVERRTRVKRDFVEALEEMDVKLLPGKAYAVPYLRSYAQVLGLSEDEVVAQYLREAALSREDARPQVRDPTSRPRGMRPWAPVAALGAVAIGVVGWQAAQHALMPEPVAAAEAASPSVAAHHPADDLAPPLPAYRAEIEIRALAEASLEARGPDGTVYFHEVMRPGEIYRPDPGPGWTFHAANGAEFEVWVDGAPSGPLGDAGKPVLGRRFDQAPPPPAPRAAPRALAPTAPAAPVAAAPAVVTPAVGGPPAG